MKLKKLYEHYDVVTEAVNTKTIKVSYNLNLNVDNGNFKAKGNGFFKIGQEVFQNIMSVEDVINLIINKETKNVQVVKRDGVDSKQILAQMLFAFLDKNNAKYLSIKDEIYFTFDYGPSDTNCVGLIVSKPIGSPSFSIVMRMDKQALPNEFNKEAVDMRILTYSSTNSTNS